MKFFTILHPTLWVAQQGWLRDASPKDLSGLPVFPSTYTRGSNRFLMYYIKAKHVKLNYYNHD